MSTMTADRTAEPPSPSARELEQLAVELALGAADVVRRASGAGAVSVKSTRTDLVTEVDKAVERWLVERITSARPHDGVLGEEGGARPGGGSGVRWVLDPIDGTVNFVLGLPQYAVSVAAELHGRVVAGAVCNPASGELFHARAGGGAHLDGVRLDGPRAVPAARAVLGTGFAYAASMRARQGAVIAELLPLVGDVRRLGAASLDLCAVAAGRLDGYFEAGLHRWDYAAGLLIATEAGCVSVGPHGREPGEGFLAVAGAGLATELFALLERLGAERVGEGG